MKHPVCVLVAMVFFFGGPAGAQGLNTPGLFVAQCEKPIEHWTLMCEGFLHGMRAMMDTMQSMGKEWACLPAGIEDAERKALLLRYLKPDLSRWRASTSAAYLIALREAFPCRP